MSASALKWSVYSIVTAIAVSLLAGCGSGGSAKGGGQKSAVPAQVLTLHAQTVGMSKSYPALLRSKQQVQVVARVGGFLEKRYYDEGQHVTKGEKLFTIEPAPYKAQLEQKQADLASAKASEHETRLNWERVSTLYKRHVDSRQQRDDAKAKLETAQASVKQAKAAVDQAQINMGYTQVKAPVSGMIGLRKVNVGNLVQASQQLATITPLNPIEARFSMPVSEAAALRAQRANQKAPKVSAVITTSGGKTVTGKVDFLGSRVDQQTSTVQARATFNNPHAVFLPGQFVRVKLEHLQLHYLLAVPQAAVGEGQEGPQLYVLDKNGQAQPRNVNLGAQVGHWIIVTHGVKPGDRVVVDHIATIDAGTPIQPQPVKGGPGRGLEVAKQGGGRQAKGKGAGTD